jgi:hypothetical protein
MVLETLQGIGPRKMYWLTDIAKYLKRDLNALNLALSVERHPAIRQRLDAITICRQMPWGKPASAYRRACEQARERRCHCRPDVS